MSDTLTGVIKFYNETNKFGFIICNSREYFFHSNDCIDSITEKHKDKRVSFIVGENKKGECAKQVKIIN